MSLIRLLPARAAPRGRRLLACILALALALAGALGTLGLARASSIVVSVCDEAHLDAAIANSVAGDKITFSCSGTITLTHTVEISHNLTLDGSGQKVTISGNKQVPVLLVDKQVVFRLNSLTIANGLAQGNLTNGVFSDGGGLVNEGGTVTITNSTFQNNQALATPDEDACGGGIYNTGGILYILNSTFTGNFAAGSSADDLNDIPGSNGEGGGLCNTGSGRVTISSSTFSNNFVMGGQGGNNILSIYPGQGLGGAIYNFGTLSINDSTITGNSASAGQSQFIGIGSTADGGGIFGDGMTTIRFSTIAANTIQPDGTFGGFPAGGGNLAFLTLGITGSIIAGSADSSNCIDLGSFPINDSGYNLEDTNTCGFSPSRHDLVNTNPDLGPLANNGGPTQTMALKAGSPAINAGGNQANACPSIDQRGAHRLDGPACDMGAYEA